MYDKGKILAGLVIFFGLLSFPFWYTIATGNAGYYPEVEKVPEAVKAREGGACMLPADEMRANHMDLLNEWRDLAVREGVRQYEVEGRAYPMSLTNTCLNCHQSKKNFCDKCHDYMGVTPYCWTCHVIPEDLEVNR